MEWLGPFKPSNYSPYDHVICDTPIGSITIEWKSWKENDSYTIYIKGEYIGDEYSLEEAKNKSIEYLKNINVELGKFLKEI